MTHEAHVFITLACLAAAVAIATASPAIAAPRRSGDGYGTVTAHSRYGNPSRTARVRRGQFGPEVEIGNNTWMHCEAGDCAYTLRRQKVDFWETIREESTTGGRD